ncbi:MAG TPA: YceI family protein [Streptosporangiaceae bacterium]|jgi:polyisoprenoid-binding protein YceI|nr:YceI family protein [Streptosporangiaceae bacterium]
MATATVQIPATGTYRIDPASSSVSFTTRHMFGLGAVKGTFGVLSGEVTIADPVTASTARAVIDAASFSGGHPQRDKDVKSANFLHVEEHPHITFESSDLAREGDAWLLHGQLTVRGHSAPVALAVTESRASGDGLTLRGTTRIDRYAFGLSKKKGLAARYLDLEITAQASKHSPDARAANQRRR